MINIFSGDVALDMCLKCMITYVVYLLNLFIIDFNNNYIFLLIRDAGHNYSKLEYILYPRHTIC